MDGVLALALVSLGAFIWVLITALIYVWAVRPRLLGEVDRTLAPEIEISDLHAKQQDILRMVQSNQVVHQDQLNEVNEKIEALSRFVVPRPVRTPTRIVDIDGIGPIYAKQLQAAGIDTFEKLAALSPEQLREMINVPQGRRIDAEYWLEQARRYAAWVKEAQS